MLNHRTDSMYDGAVAGPRSVDRSRRATPRPVIRAQIVPIASRREIAPGTSRRPPSRAGRSRAGRKARKYPKKLNSRRAPAPAPVAVAAAVAKAPQDHPRPKSSPSP